VDHPFLRQTLYFHELKDIDQLVKIRYPKNAPSTRPSIQNSSETSTAATPKTKCWTGRTLWDCPSLPLPSNSSSHSRTNLQSKCTVATDTYSLAKPDQPSLDTAAQTGQIRKGQAPGTVRLRSQRSQHPSPRAEDCSPDLQGRVRPVRT
jgi:hypothetical protein